MFLPFWKNFFPLTPYTGRYIINTVFLPFWVEEKPTTWYTVLCGRWSVPRSRGGDAHDNL